jgi:hypothetical protein
MTSATQKIFINNIINNEKLTEFFKTSIKIAHVKYTPTSVQGFDEPQTVITAVTFRLEAADLNGELIDSWVFEIEVPLMLNVTGAEFIPYENLNFDQVMDWPDIGHRLITEVTDFQARVKTLVDARSKKQEPLIIVPTWSV